MTTLPDWKWEVARYFALTSKKFDQKLFSDRGKQNEYSNELT